MWLALRTRTGGEAKAIEALRERGLTPYCPMMTRWGPKPRRGDRKEVRAAIWPGYVFIPTSDNASCYALMQAGLIYGFLDRLIPAEPMTEIQVREQAGEFNYIKDRRKAQRAKRKAMQLAEFARLDREQILQELRI